MAAGVRLLGAELYLSVHHAERGFGCLLEQSGTAVAQVAVTTGVPFVLAAARALGVFHEAARLEAETLAHTVGHHVVGDRSEADCLATPHDQGVVGGLPQLTTDGGVQLLHGSVDELRESASTEPGVHDYGAVFAVLGAVLPEGREAEDVDVVLAHDRDAATSEDLVQDVLRLLGEQHTTNLGVLAAGPAADHGGHQLVQPRGDAVSNVDVHAFLRTEGLDDERHGE